MRAQGTGEAKIPCSFQDDDEDVPRRSSLFWAGKNVDDAEKKQKLVKAVFYAVQVFYSFFIM